MACVTLSTLVLLLAHSCFGILGTMLGTFFGQLTRVGFGHLAFGQSAMKTKIDQICFGHLAFG